MDSKRWYYICSSNQLINAVRMRIIANASIITHFGLLRTVIKELAFPRTLWIQACHEILAARIFDVLLK
jgi:hypothetical protein